MTIEIKDGMFVHDNHMIKGGTSVRHVADGVVTITIESHGAMALDVFNYADRLALARFLLTDVAWGPTQTLESFMAGAGGNSDADRLAYVNSFGEDWESTRDATDLRTWINHGDSSRVDGVWDERIKAYYKARGY